MAFNYSAFQFRMATGFPGDISRTHPQTWVEPGLNDTTNPVQFFGSAVLLTTSGNSYRGILSSDTGVTVISGIASRPYPIQPSSATNFGTVAFNSLILPQAGEIAVVRQGYVLVPVVGSVVKGGTVYLWVAATSGSNVQGGFQATSSGNTVTLTNCQYNGPAGTDGIAEIYIKAGF